MMFVENMFRSGIFVFFFFVCLVSSAVFTGSFVRRDVGREVDVDRQSFLAGYSDGFVDDFCFSRVLRVGSGGDNVTVVEDMCINVSGLLFVSDGSVLVYHNCTVYLNPGRVVLGVGALLVFSLCDVFVCVGRFDVVGGSGSSVRFSFCSVCGNESGVFSVRAFSVDVFDCVFSVGSFVVNVSGSVVVCGCVFDGCGVDLCVFGRVCGDVVVFVENVSAVWLVVRYWVFVRDLGIYIHFHNVNISRSICVFDEDDDIGSEVYGRDLIIDILGCTLKNLVCLVGYTHWRYSKMLIEKNILRSFAIDPVHLQKMVIYLSNNSIYEGGHIYVRGTRMLYFENNIIRSAYIYVGLFWPGLVFRGNRVINSTIEIEIDTDGPFLISENTFIDSDLYTHTDIYADIFDNLSYQLIVDNSFVYSGGSDVEWLINFDGVGLERLIVANNSFVALGETGDVVPIVVDVAFKVVDGDVGCMDICGNEFINLI